MEDLTEEYQTSLNDLTFNSKPHINVLTILAEENKNYAETIVQLIEAQITKATEKLPLLYLLDSIIKNVGENYKPLFAKNLTSIFKLSFQKADDKSKMSMYKLRTTWDNYFPLKALHSLDVAIKELDGNWPVKPLPTHLQDNASSTNIHVNPKFIKKTNNEVDKIRQQLVRQQKELLDLQQKKLMLELEQTKQKLANKKREAQESVVKRQEKSVKDPRKQASSINAPGGLRVTLSNDKTNIQSKAAAPKDPRLTLSKGSAKDLAATVKSEVPKSSASSMTKKKVAKPLPKKEKPESPKPSPQKTKPSPVLKTEELKRKTAGVSTTKKKDTGGKNQKVSATATKKKQTSSKSSSSPPAKIPRNSSSSRVSHEEKRTVDQSPQKKYQRIPKQPNRPDVSSQSSESSLSPRFSPEPGSESPQSGPVTRREDALRRRPSFDPDLHIPKELTLGHQNDILRQAELQLQSGQLTHRQHQELLKQLHQLFEVQRMKKIHEADDVQHGRSHFPSDPRQSRKNRISKRPHSEIGKPLEDTQRPRKLRPGQISGPLARRNSGPRTQSPPHQYPPRAGPNQRPPDRKQFQVDLEPVPPSIRPRHPHMVPDRSRKMAMRHSSRFQSPSINEHRKPPNYPMHQHDKRPPPSESLRRRPTAVRNQDQMQNRLVNDPRQNRVAKPQQSPEKDPRRRDHHFKPVQEKTQHEVEVAPLSPPPGPPLSPPPFFTHSKSADQLPDLNKPSEVCESKKQNSLRRFAHADSFKPVDDEEKTTLEEPEDYIIANMPKDDKGPSKRLEEPEDYIIAGVSNATEEEKASCEEPEDFIIAQMPPGAEAYHKHSLGLRKNSDSKKAYLDHMQKIKQSIYSNEKKSQRKPSLSDTSLTATESESEKTSNQTDTQSEKEEIKSPSLPLKKRRYISSDDAKTKETKQENVSTTEEKSDSESKPESASAATKVDDSKKDVESQPDEQSSVDLPSSKLAETEELKSSDAIKTNDVLEKEQKTVMTSTEKNTVEPKKTKVDANKSKAGDKFVKNSKEKSKEKGSKQKETRNAFQKSVRRERKEKESSDNNSLVYVIEDEDSDPNTMVKERKERRPPRRPGNRAPHPDDWHRGNLMFNEEEEMRLRRIYDEEQKQMEWEETLTRELKREQWNEERMRDHRLRSGRGRGRFPPPGRWESPPRELREPPNFDIARGQIFRHEQRMPRPFPRRPGSPPFGLRPVFPSDEGTRMRRPLNDPRRPLSPPPGMMRPPGWVKVNRPLTPPPGHRLPHLPFHKEFPPDWERPIGRPIPPREPPFRPDEHDRPRFIEPPHAPEPAPTFTQVTQVNVNKLLTDLVSMGIIPGSKKAEDKSSSPAPTSETPKTAVLPQPADTNSPEEKKEEPQRSVSPFIEEDLMMLDPDAQIPEVTLTSDLKVRHDEIIKRLYTGIQCSACGLRFTTRQTDLYADHLDWHYRVNRKDKEGGVVTHRELYPSAGEWICYEEVDNPQERTKNSFFDETDNAENAVKLETDCNVPLTGKAGEDICKVCKEAFETFYNENDDEWQFANCVKVDGDNFHPNCYGDYQDNVPAPSSTSEEVTLQDGTQQPPVIKEEVVDDTANTINTDIQVKQETLDETPTETAAKDELKPDISESPQSDLPQSHSKEDETSDSKSRASEPDGAVVVEEEKQEEATKMETKSDVAEIALPSVTEDVEAEGEHEVLKVDNSPSTTPEKDQAVAEDQETSVAATTEIQPQSESESNTTS